MKNQKSKLKDFLIKKTKVKLSKSDVKRSPKISDGGYVWAG